ncbi:MAG: hypothetical protein FWG91_11420 [Lachnospiraceae bacterium]|nr:hypothetical protein [Lachnospiraceae bacterium]
MKISIALYPYCAEMLPLVRHFEKMQEKYTITRLFSLPGLGLGGKDAAYALNHPHLGLLVQDKFEPYDPSWAVLFLTRVPLKIIDNEWLAKITETTLLAGKKVVYFDNCEENVPRELLRLTDLYPDGIVIITEDKQSTEAGSNAGKYGLLKTAVILVGGLVAANDTYEVLLAMASCLRKQGLRPAVISKHCHIKMLGKEYHCFNHIMARHGITEAEKIELLNSYIMDLEQAEIPDIILIEAPDSVMRYNNIAPHGFGIQSHMLCQATAPDYFVCCIPKGLAEGEFLTEISKNLFCRLGSYINAVHVSNVVVDSAEVLQTKKVSYVHTNLSEVQEQIAKQRKDSEIPLFDVITDGANCLCEALLIEH